MKGIMNGILRAPCHRAFNFILGVLPFLLFRPLFSFVHYCKSQLFFYSFCATAERGGVSASGMMAHKFLGVIKWA